MLTNEEIAVRRTTVGASDVPKLFNSFDNKKAQDLWEFKVGLTEHIELDNKYITFGNLTEEVCLQQYFKDFEMDGVMNERIEHTSIKSFIASTDGLVGDIPIENKGKNEKGFYALEKPERDHIIQVYAQLSCTGGDFGVIVYNCATEEDYELPLLYNPEGKQRIFTVERDDKFIEELEQRVTYFLMCMREVKRPSEKDFKEWLKC